MPCRRVALAVGLLLGLTSAASAQPLAARVSVLQAEDRRAPKPGDLSTLRSAARNRDGDTARLALRALGRLERPALIPDILGGLRHALPEVRLEAAIAVAQAAQGLKAPGAASMSLGPAQAALIARLGVDDDADVRAAVCESLARLPYTSAVDAARAESVIVDFAGRATSITDKLGIARGLEAFVRLQQPLSPAGPASIDVLRTLARPASGRSADDLLRDARIRRLSLDALAATGGVDAATLAVAVGDPDPQVRRLAVRAATIDGTDAIVTRGLSDPAAMVRIEALRTSRLRTGGDACAAAVSATDDPEMAVAIVAIDQLGSCGQLDRAVATLTAYVARRADAEAPRNWHRAAHALVALSTAAAAAAAPAIPAYAQSPVWQLRVYAARAATIAGRRDVLDRLARDADDNVVEAAITALGGTARHDADDLYIAALARDGYQVVRAAALALDHSPAPAAAIGPLRRALDSAEDDGRPGAADARAALRATLASLGVTLKPAKPGTQAAAPINAADLKRLAAPTARFIVRDAGVFDVALVTTEAPATVLRFAQLAASGYYNGLTFHRVVPNGVVQGGSPGANEYVSDAPYMRDEVGGWPHVRGALGISTRGRDTGDAQIFIDLVDNPRFDHTYTVFGQVLGGMDAVDRLLEGDVIERIEIIP